MRDMEGGGGGEGEISDGNVRDAGQLQCKSVLTKHNNGCGVCGGGGGESFGRKRSLPRVVGFMNGP